jgi:hypothetical protein
LEKQLWIPEEFIASSDRKSINKMIRNIIWDVDGTLFDTYPSFANSFRQAVNDLGKDAPLDWITQAAKISMDHCITALSERCELNLKILKISFPPIMVK